MKPSKRPSTTEPWDNVPFSPETKHAIKSHLNKLHFQGRWGGCESYFFHFTQLTKDFSSVDMWGINGSLFSWYINDQIWRKYRCISCHPQVKLSVREGKGSSSWMRNSWAAALSDTEELRHKRNPTTTGQASHEVHMSRHLPETWG